ncbi:hypothetical protein [Methylobacterium sp. yr596]|uniref:hypothetical protein n=1 Tax=Methylobacterium sp. yr596 TaxID=1761800 RepID=UPI0008EAC315|nr:hypothetical protein [Methylobacterium sp. yr596]SFF76972.1 hypothetical protein SAMN04487844_14724 [Methylobacterium sp. yr596]
MREITTHRVNPANDRLVIEVLDEPGSGGANHLYEVSGFDYATNASAGPHHVEGSALVVLFQNGPIAEAGVNGVTQEVLLAIVIDRLRSFQRGPYACRENALALTKIEEAQHWLLARTRDRMAKGVEGTHAKREDEGAAA